MRTTACFGLLICCWLTSTTAVGDLRISLSDLELQPGEVGSVDVFVSSNDGNDQLDAFSLELAISGSGVMFVEPQSDHQLTDPDYLFYFNSQALIYPPASTLLGPRRAVVFDATDFAPVTVPITEQLLARLDLMALGPAGDFDLSLEGSLNVLSDDNTFVTRDLLSEEEITLPRVDLAASDLVATVTVVPTEGDFNGNRRYDAGDIDLLSVEVRAGTNDPFYNLNDDNVVDQQDREIWINQLARTYFGDANLDGEFNSSDFVDVFVGGEYEDGVVGNSTWATGDWSGDSEFDSSDFVSAFVAGGYELGPRPSVKAVPEPTTVLSLALGMAAMAWRRRRLPARQDERRKYPG